MYSKTIKKVHEAQTSTRKVQEVPSTIVPHPSTLYLCVISAKSSEGREEVARHLRYWPYVKFFKYQGDRHLLCCFYLGEAKDGYQLKQLFERSRQLVLLCLRQYDVTITRWKALPEGFKLFHNNKLVIRTDKTLKPLIIYMGEFMSGDAVNRDRTLIIPHPSSIGHHSVPQNLSKIYKRISQCILSIF